jgi:hypothetical protein
MKAFLLSICSFFIFQITTAHYIKWGIQFGPDYRGIQPKGMCTDDYGNSYVFGDDRFALPGVRAFVIKISPTGQYLWRTDIPDIHCLEFLNFSKITADRQGFVYILGNTICNQVDAGIYSIGTSSGSIGSYIIRLNPDGSINYLIDVNDDMKDIAADYHGNVYVSGNIATEKHDSTGTFLWMNTNCKGHAIDVTPDGRSFVTDSITSWRISPAGIKTWQGTGYGGDDIAFNRYNSHLIISTAGSIKEISFNPFIVTNHLFMHSGKLKTDLYGNVYVKDGVLIQKMDSNYTLAASAVIPFCIDYGVSRTARVFALGSFNNLFEEFNSCNFTTEFGDPNGCLSNCEDDGFLVKVAMETAPLLTRYNYPSACTGQNNPVEPCSDRSFPAGNVFNIELSDANGSFSQPLSVGIAPNAILPSGLPPGNGYRFRVVSTNPVIIGNPSHRFSIETSPGPIDISITGSATICDSGYIKFDATDSSGAPYVVDWYGDIGYTGHAVYLATDDTLTATDYGMYYAMTSQCYGISNWLDAISGCRKGDFISSINLKLFPNPVSAHLNIEFICDAETSVLITVTDMMSRILESKEIHAIDGLNKLMIDVSDYSRSMYLITLQTKTSTLQSKFLVQ